MLYLINPLIYIIAPVILISFILTIYCLMRLLFLDLPKKQFWMWNFFILIFILIGSLTFLLCYYCFRKQVFKSAGIYKEKEAVMDIKTTDTTTDPLIHSEPRSNPTDKTE